MNLIFNATKRLRTKCLKGGLRMYVRTCIVTVLGRSLIISRTSSLPAATAASDPRNFIINNYGEEKIKSNKIQVYG